MTAQAAANYTQRVHSTRARHMTHRHWGHVTPITSLDRTTSYENKNRDTQQVTRKHPR